MILNVKDQSALVLGRDIRDSVAYKMFRGVNGESPEQNEKGEQGQREPLVFVFLLEQAPPPSSHDSCCGVRPMKTLLPNTKNGTR